MKLLTRRRGDAEKIKEEKNRERNQHKKTRSFSFPLFLSFALFESSASQRLRVKEFSLY
jgi:hypothetical protein